MHMNPPKFGTHTFAYNSKVFFSFLFFLQKVMDWFSWLSRTNLDPSIVYEYGLEFARNELKSEDLVYFDHEFLLSMGITIARHRLEILKLAKKDVGPGPISLFKLFNAISKTKKGIKKRLARWVYPQVSAVKALPEPHPEVEPERYGERWRGALSLARKFKSEKEFSLERPPTPVIKPTRRQAKSGPLDRKRMQESYMFADNNNNNRSLKLSGPLDGKVNERLVLAYRSPKSSVTPERLHPRFIIPPSRSPQPHWSLDSRSVNSNGYYSDFGKERAVNADPDEHSVWPSLFQDMKPT